MFIVVLAVLLVGIVASDWNLWVGSAALQTTDDAYLQADLTPLAAKSPGYVRSVPVQDFQKVKAGDLLVEIVDDDYRAQLDQAQANVETAETAIENIEQQKVVQGALVQQAEAAIEATQADLTRYHLETVRQQNLLITKYAGTEQRVEQAVDAEKHTQATLALNQAQLAQQRQQLNVLDTQEKQAKAALKAQQAARDLAKIALGYTRIVAPVDGMVSERRVRPGQYVSLGTQVISLVPLPDVWVVANYKEVQMTRVRLGQPARVTVDAFPGVVLYGHVDSWSPASGCPSHCPEAATRTERACRSLHRPGRRRASFLMPRPVRAQTRCASRCSSAGGRELLAELVEWGPVIVCNSDDVALRTAPPWQLPKQYDRLAVADQ
jgi:membrane fusion protein (multidrug efflux system)